MNITSEADIILEKLGYKKIYNGDNTIKYKGTEHPDIVFNMILYVYYVDGYISKELHKAIVLKMKELKW